MTRVGRSKKLTGFHFPTRQEFYQNPIGTTVAYWIIASGASAILIPRATVVFLTILGLGILIDSIVKKRAPLLPERPFTGAIISVLMLAAISYYWTVSPDITLRKLPRLGILLLWGLLALAAVQNTTPKIAEWAMTLTIMAFTGALVVIAIEINFDNAIYRTLITLIKQSPPPSYVNGNVVNQPALLIALFLWPVGLALWLKGLRFFAIALIGSALVIFATSGSQSVALAIIFGAVACGATAMFPHQIKLWLSLILIGLMLAALKIPLLLQSLVQGYENLIPTSGLHRLEIWNFAISKIQERPLAGFGLDTSRILGESTSSLAIPGASLLPLHPHNGFLQIWLELGLAGYVILGFLCLWIIHKISRLKGARKVFSVGMLVCGLSLFATAYGMWQSWVIAAQFSATGALLLSFSLIDKNR